MYSDSTELHPLVRRMNALEVRPGSLGFYFLGQVGLAIRGPEGVIYIDPYLTDSDGAGGHLPRNFPPPLEPNDVRNALGVLVTHDHLDHFDRDTLGPLAQASPQAVFAGSHTCDFSSLDIAASRWAHPHVLEPFEIASASITAIPSAHTNLGHSSAGFPYHGYVIEWNGVRVYHAGDTVIWDANSHPELNALPATDRVREGLIGLLAPLKLDVAFVPINGRDHFRTAQGIIGNTNELEAALLAEALDVDLIVPTHFDLFNANPGDPGAFVNHLRRINPLRRHKIMRPGELLYFLTEPR